MGKMESIWGVYGVRGNKQADNEALLDQFLQNETTKETFRGALKAVYRQQRSVVLK